MKIGILTGGGHVPGLNPCIKALVNRAVDEGHTVIGIRRGWAGLLHYNPAEEEESKEKWIVPLNKPVVRPIDRADRAFLHTSRINPSQLKATEVPQFLRGSDWQPEQTRSKDYTAHILQNLEQLEIEALVSIGGDDTLHYAHHLHTKGFPVIAIPKTMDNDIYGTDYCIGFSTAVTRSINFINDLRTAVGSHERIGVIELFGRNSGETSLISAYLADVDRAIISEVPFDPKKLATLLMEDKRNNPSNYAIMTISEGASMIGGKVIDRTQADTYALPISSGIGSVTGNTLKTITGEKIIYQQVAYLMRSGAPDSIDLMVSLNFANMSMDLIRNNDFGQMVAVKEGKYTNVPTSILVQGIKRVDVDELYDVEAYRPKLRHVNQKPMFLY